MKIALGMTTCFAFVFCCCSNSFARPSPKVSVHTAPKTSATINTVQAVGPQVISDPGITSYTNNGTINGGASAGLTVTSPSVTSVTNNGNP